MNPQSTLSKEERKFATEYLEKTKEMFLKSLEGLSEKQFHHRLDEQSWSILQCAEHITVSEIGIFKNAMLAMQKPIDEEKLNEIKVNEHVIIKAVGQRVGKAASPDFLIPEGRYANIPEIIEAFNKQRLEVIHYMNETQEELHRHYARHFVLGMMDIYLFIIFMAAHCERHVRQIEEIKTHESFPKD